MLVQSMFGRKIRKKNAQQKQKKSGGLNICCTNIIF